MRKEIEKAIKETLVVENKQSIHLAVDKICNLFNVSRGTSYLDDKYEVKWLINDTYQVEQNGQCVYQGTESDCNEWLKCQLGYCG